MSDRQGKMSASVMAQKCGLYLKEASKEELELIKNALLSRNDTKRAHKIFKFLVEQSNPQADYQRAFHSSIDKLTKQNSNPELKSLIDDLIRRADERISGQSMDVYSTKSDSSPEELLESINTNSTEKADKLYWPIQLPDEDEPRIFEYSELEPDEIDLKTEVIDVHNSRFQRNTKALEVLASLIAKAGQTQPAFAYWPEGRDKASVLDGSRRRAGCKLARKNFRMFFTRDKLSESQIDFLASIFESQEKLSYPEQASRLALRFLSAQAYAEKEGRKLSRNEFASEQTRFKKSHVYNVIDHGCVSPNLYMLFPKLEFCTQNWCNTKLMPLINKILASDLVEIKGKSDNDKFDAIFAASNLIAKHVAECKEQINKDEDAWIDTFHTDIIGYVEATLFSSDSEEKDEKKKRKTPKLSYVAGKNTRSKNWIRQTSIEQDEPYQASVKISDPTVKEAFSKLLEAFAKEHDL